MVANGQAQLPHAPPQPAPLRRLDYLDALRAVAVFVVFFIHVTETFIRVSPGHPLLFRVPYDLNFGRVGVVTFFAISGFLIPTSLRGPTAPGLTRFLVTRTSRLYPAFLVSLVPCVLTYTAMSQGAHLPARDVWLNLTMVPRLFDATMANGAYWTLEVELVFYALCVALFAGGVLRDAFVLAAIMSVLFGLFYSSQVQLWGGLLNPRLDGDTFFFGLNLACMFWGATIRRWWDGDRLNALTLVLLALFSWYWLIFLPGALLLDRTGLLPRPGIDARLVAGYSIGLWLFVLGLFVVRIRVPAISWFGRISYSFYLTHQAGIFIPFTVVRHNPWLQDARMPWYLLAALICSTALAAASFYLVERPFIRWGHRLAARLAPSAR